VFYLSALHLALHLSLHDALPTMGGGGVIFIPGIAGTIGTSETSAFGKTAPAISVTRPLTDEAAPWAAGPALTFTGTAKAAARMTAVRQAELCRKTMHSPFTKGLNPWRKIV